MDPVPCVGCNLPGPATPEGPWCGSSCRSAYEALWRHQKAVEQAALRRDARRAAIRDGRIDLRLFAPTDPLE